MVVYDTMGRSYSLNETNLSGGEGRIYNIDGTPLLCAKIFKEGKRSKGRECKILHWQDLLEQRVIKDDFTAQVVIPQKAVYTQPYHQDQKNFCGYIMEKQVGFTSLKSIYINEKLDYAEQVWIAGNICIMTRRIHSLGMVVGDYNPDNVAVFLSTSKVKFIDVDSFQQIIVRSNGERVLCPCNVGVPEFLAPEVIRRLRREKANLENIDQSQNNPVFTEYTDRYAMAYHIFCLLMNGASPFSAMANMEEIAKHPSMTVSNVDIDRVRAAERGEFVFAKKTPFKKPPKYAPKYDVLTPRLKSLFERAFIEGATSPEARPDEEEFYEALYDYGDSLEPRACGHYMPSYYSGKCEWCRITN